MRAYCWKQWCDEEEGTDSVAVLLWEFDILPSGTMSYIAGNNAERQELEGLPLANLDQVCNCTMGRYVFIICDNSVAQPELAESSDDSDGDEGETENLENNDSHSEFFSFTARCRGSTFEPHQSVLAQLHTDFADIMDIEIKLCKEISNVHDKNAIAYRAMTKTGEYHTIGYVGKMHLPRMHVALKNGQVNVKLTLLRRKYNVVAKKVIYTCFISHTKARRWEKVDHTYQYNSSLQI